MMRTMTVGSTETKTPPRTKPLACSAVLTHHWLVRHRGGEKVLAALRELLPKSPVYTLVHDPAGYAKSLAGEAPSVPTGTPGDGIGNAPPFQGWGTESTPVRTSFLQRIPGAKKHYPKLLPLMPAAARAIRLPPVDLVVCSDAAIAKAMTPDPRSKLLCYCHSPMRYVWEPEIQEAYRRSLSPVLRPLFNLAARRIRVADYRAAQRVDQFVANSQHVADRIRRHYGRDSVVIHPPVDLPAAPADGPREAFYLCVGYHVPYKRLDLAVEACRELGRELVIIGEGPDLRRIDAGRDRHVTVLGWQPEQSVRDHYRRARALIFPGEEDFGMVPVEAMAHGCPVIAYAVGGARETVVPGETGVWFGQQSTQGLIEAIRRFEETRFDPHVLHAHSRQFGKERFLRQMREVSERVLEI
ncbi:MAG: glycosyltransferase [Planctomycetes bacterium]|nr:glycosyltransferase [Planctomycetota bacterium]